MCPAFIGRLSRPNMSVPDPFDPKYLALSPSSVAVASPKPTRLPAPAKGEHYLGGPIPLRWLSPAAALPGKAFHVALAVWHEARLSRSQSSTVKLRPATLRRFGVDCRRTRYRALAALERAGLIAIEKRTGR